MNNYYLNVPSWIYLAEMCLIYLQNIPNTSSIKNYSSLQNACPTPLEEETFPDNLNNSDNLEETTPLFSSRCQNKPNWRSQWHHKDTKYWVSIGCFYWELYCAFILLTHEEPLFGAVSKWIFTTSMFVSEKASDLSLDNNRTSYFICHTFHCLLADLVTCYHYSCC